MFACVCEVATPAILLGDPKSAILSELEKKIFCTWSFELDRALGGYDS